METSANTIEIKRLLTLSEIAQAKVEFNSRGTQVINPRQQAAASRLYNRAYKLKGVLSVEEFSGLHNEVIKEMK